MSTIHQVYIQYGAKDTATQVASGVANKVTTSNNKIKSSYQGLANSATKYARQVNSAMGTLQATALASFSALFAFFLKSTTDTGMAIDRFKNQMLIATGSIEGASVAWTKAIALANETGASLGVVTDTYGKFSIAAKSAGMSASELDAVYRSLIEGTVAMGLGQEQVKLALKAVEQMMSKGTVMAEELKGQFGEQIPDAMGLASRAMGVTTGELMKMMEQGKLMSSDLVPKLAAQMKSEWGVAAQNATTQLRVSVNRLGTAFTELQDALFSSGVQEFAANAIGFLTEKVKQLTDFVRGDMIKIINDMKATLNNAFGVDYIDRFKASLSSLFETIKSIVAWTKENIGVDGLITYLLIGLLMRNPFILAFRTATAVLTKFWGKIVSFTKTFVEKFSAMKMAVSDFDRWIMKAVASLTLLLGLEAKRRGEALPQQEEVKNVSSLTNFQSKSQPIVDLANEIRPDSVMPSMGNVGLDLYQESLNIQKTAYQDMLDEQMVMFENLGQQEYQEGIKLAKEMADMQLAWKKKEYEDAKSIKQQALDTAWEMDLRQFEREADLEDKRLEMKKSNAEQMAMMEKAWRQKGIDDAKKEEEEKKQGMTATLGTAANMFGTMASMQDTSSKKGFETWKQMSTMQALINTYMGITNAMATVPFPYNIAVAAMVGAMGAMQVAKIQSTQFQPRMGGGNVIAGEAYTVGENGKEMFVPNTNGRIYPNSQLEGKGGASTVVRQDNKEVKISFNITAADTRDMDRLIMDRMPMIVNGVRRGLA